MSTVAIRIPEAAYERLNGLADLYNKSVPAMVDELSEKAFESAAPFVRDMRRLQAEAAKKLSKPLPTVGDEVDEESIQREVRRERAAASMDERGGQG